MLGLFILLAGYFIGLCLEPLLQNELYSKATSLLEWSSFSLVRERY